MRKLFIVLPLFVFLTTSCSSVKVTSDYSKEANFNTYKTFAFFKAEIDTTEISDWDKQKILRVVEKELFDKGLTKSENPDLIVNIFTSSRKKISLRNRGWKHHGAGWSSNPLYYSKRRTSGSMEGSLYVNLIDTSKKEMIWQGVGTGYLTQKTDKKEERIKEFVFKIMEKYPPGVGK